MRRCEVKFNRIRNLGEYAMNSNSKNKFRVLIPLRKTGPPPKFGYPLKINSMDVSDDFKPKKNIFSFWYKKFFFGFVKFFGFFFLPIFFLFYNEYEPNPLPPASSFNLTA